MAAMAQSATPPASVLIVDDHEKMRRLMRHLLPEEVVAIHECGDGADAIATFEACRPDCVLMDIEMPVLDGIRATREIIRRHPGARIIVVTHFDDPLHRELALGAGAEAVVSKTRLGDLRSLLTHRPPA